MNKYIIPNLNITASATHKSFSDGSLGSSITLSVVPTCKYRNYYPLELGSKTREILSTTIQLAISLALYLYRPSAYYIETN